jgi:hypothetical protein
MENANADRPFFASLAKCRTVYDESLYVTQGLENGFLKISLLADMPFYRYF